jgi:hypothetical protein
MPFYVIFIIFLLVLISSLLKYYKTILKGLQKALEYISLFNHLKTILLLMRTIYIYFIINANYTYIIIKQQYKENHF